MARYARNPVKVKFRDMPDEDVIFCCEPSSICIKRDVFCFYFSVTIRGFPFCEWLSGFAFGEAVELVVRAVETVETVENALCCFPQFQWFPAAGFRGCADGCFGSAIIRTQNGDAHVAIHHRRPCALCYHARSHDTIRPFPNRPHPRGVPSAVPAATQLPRRVVEAVCNAMVGAESRLATHLIDGPGSFRALQFRESPILPGSQSKAAAWQNRSRQSFCSQGPLYSPSRRG